MHISEDLLKNLRREKGKMNVIMKTHEITALCHHLNLKYSDPTRGKHFLSYSIVTPETKPKWSHKPCHNLTCLLYPSSALLQVLRI